MIELLISSLLLSNIGDDASKHATLAYMKYKKYDVYLEETLTDEQKKTVAYLSTVSSIIENKQITYTWSF